jgi:hypothetical protein
MTVAAVASIGPSPIYTDTTFDVLKSVQLQQQRLILERQLAAEETSKTDSAQVQARKEAAIQQQIDTIQTQITQQQTQAAPAGNNTTTSTNTNSGNGTTTTVSAPQTTTPSSGVKPASVAGGRINILV